MFESTNINKPFVAQMKAFFGLLPGQSVTGFGAELKALSAADKLEFAAMLNAAGYPCDPPQVAAAA